MVKICSETYEGENEIFQTYPFELSAFQKHAIDAIENGKHVLITAHTGSGKTLPAAYAIQKFCKLGKKVIYTSPIKALSNQKFNEFTKKFPEISFGIITGDIKFNPEADCVIMTTEILRNNLFNKKLVNKELNNLYNLKWILKMNLLVSYLMKYIILMIKKGGKYGKKQL